MKKSSSYREAFRQHRKLLSLPTILAFFIAAWFVFGAQKSYQSTVSLWVDNGPTADSSLGNVNPALTPPSQQEQQVITELLATPNFVLAVGHHSALASYLAANTGGGMSPTALLKKFSGPGSLDSRIIGALGPKALVTSVPGPQVLQISFNGPTPAVAQSTLTALVAQLRQDSVRFTQQHSLGTLSYYKSQVQAATRSLNSIRAQANEYLKQHPNAPTTDPNLTALTAAEGDASTQLTQANSSLSAAATAAKGGSSSDIQVISSPSTPTGPTSSKKKEIMELFAGLFAGLLISFLGTIALTRKTDPWEDELARTIGASHPNQVPGAMVYRSVDGHLERNGAGSHNGLEDEAVSDLSSS